MIGILLAGGHGKRLGQDKALVEIGGEPIIRRVVKRLQTFCSRIVIVGSDNAERRASLTGLEHEIAITFVPDLLPGKGALGGIYSGLKSSTSVFSLVVACDMPFLNVDFLRYMIDQAESYDVIVPRWEGHFEPLHAIYSHKCIEFIAHLLDSDDIRRIVDFFPEANVRYIDQEEIDRFDPDHLSLFNINTAEDLEMARELAARERVSP